MQYCVAEYPKLKKAMETTEMDVLFSGPWGSGKSRLLAEKAYFLAAYYPYNRTLLLRKKLKFLKATTWKFLTMDVVPKRFLTKDWYNKSDLVIRLPNGSEIWGGGILEAGDWASTEFGFVGVDQAEQITRDDDVMISGRVRLPSVPFHQRMYACNPAAPAHFLYQDFYINNGENSNRELVEGVVLWDLLPPSYKVRLDAFKGKYRDRYVEGKWVAFEGLVYDCFNPRIHMIDPLNISDEWVRMIIVDFGYSHPFVCQVWACTPEGQWVRYREIYMSHRTVTSHCETIRGWPEFEKLKKAKWICDHDAEDRATLEQILGIKTRPAKKERRIGFQRVYEMLEPLHEDEEDFIPEMLFMREALVERDPYLESAGKPTCTEDEIQGYVWASKDDAVKEDDHGMDAIRYLANELKERKMSAGIEWA